MTSRNRTIERIVSARFGIAVSDVERTLVFWRDLAANCLDMAELGFDIEDAFGFEVVDDDLDRIRTVGDLHALVARRLDVAPMAMAA